MVSQYFWPEEFRINDIATSLVQKGHQVTILTGIPNYPRGSFFKGYGLMGPYKQEYNGMCIFRVPFVSRGSTKGLRLALNFASFMISGSILGPLICRGKFDCIFVHQPSPVTTVVPGLVMKYLKQIPLYLWVTDLWPDSLTATNMVKSPILLRCINIFVRFLYKRCDKILVASKGFAPKIENQGINPKKIFYWPQWGEDLFRNRQATVKKELGLPDGFKVMFAGNIGTSQAFETIVEAAELLKANKNIQWVILGDGIKRQWVEKEIRQRNMTDCFHLIGSRPIEDMPQYYKQANALLISLKDSPLFSLTVPGKTQACLASGRPIIASINGETSDIIKEAKCGICCKASSPTELANAVTTLEQMPTELREEMGRRAEEYFESNYSREKLLSKLEEIMRL